MNSDVERIERAITEARKRFEEDVEIREDADRIREELSYLEHIGDHELANRLREVLKLEAETGAKFWAMEEWDMASEQELTDIANKIRNTVERLNALCDLAGENGLMVDLNVNLKQRVGSYDFPVVTVKISKQL